MPTKTKLGRLEPVPLSSAWAHEASDFTPWLADPENLALLGSTLGLDLELESQERNVGPFRADLLCRDTATGAWVLIENQIARTDHGHLGQILTYAAGLKAVTIIWIAESFTEEHRAVLDWLNEITADPIHFFGLEIKLFRIGDSALAPTFNIVSQPNDWLQTLSEITRVIEANELSETRKLQLEYWQQFARFLHERNSVIKPQKPYPQHWMYFSIGKSNFSLAASMNTQAKFLRVALEIIQENSKDIYHQLEAEREEIEKQFGGPLEWRELPGKIQSHIILFKQECDPLDQSRWEEEYMPWMAETLERFYAVFSKRIRSL